jgi:hypothetical protein
VRALGVGPLAAAAACAVVLGLGRLAVRGGADTTAGGSADKAASAAKGTGPEHYLACARLVAEGTVAAVAPVPGTDRVRVTVRVTRSYRPERSGPEAEVVLGPDAEPRPRGGQHVLVGVPRRGAPLWAVGDAAVARERAWITRALPAARTLGCPDG